MGKSYLAEELDYYQCRSIQMAMIPQISPHPQKEKILREIACD